MKSEYTLKEKGHLKLIQMYDDIKAENNKLNSIIIDKDKQILTFNDKFDELFDI